MRATRAVIIAVLAIQVFVPAAALTQERPARLGWHMFAGHKPPPDQLTVTTSDGSMHMRDPSDYIPRYRPEVAYEKHLPRHICEHEPDAVEVHITRRRPPLDRTHRC